MFPRLFKNKILKLAEKFGTPFYLLDAKKLEENISRFLSAFKKEIPRLKPFYAVKANHSPYIINKVLEHGYGLEVASGRELSMALKHNADDIIFNGPGKTLRELSLAVKNHNKVRINIDSFRELSKLGALTAKKRLPIRIGVRVFTKSCGKWTKFGIPLAELKKIWLQAQKHEFISLEGIHFHMSWNRNSMPYQQAIREIGCYLGKEFLPETLKSIKFIDIGGGFFPDKTEGYYPWTSRYPWISPPNGKKTTGKKYSIIRAVSFEDFAQGVKKAIAKYLRPILPYGCEYYAEPGRILCQNAMHIVVRIEDIKKEGHAIADGGVNMAGWEYGEHFYYPILNLTNPSAREIPCVIHGSLCTPHDIWGYYCYAKKISEGDIIIVFNQGAYRYSLAQNFIKPIPPIYVL